jgi:hypothetical protein
MDFADALVNDHGFPPILLEQQDESRHTSPENSRAFLWSKRRGSTCIFWSGQQDSNLRPVVPKTTALPDCAMPRLPAKH